MLHRSFSHWLLLLGLLAFACVPIHIFAQSKARQKKPAAKPEAANASQGLSISGVALSATSFNPSRGEKAELRYNLSRPAKVTVQVFDADQQLVRILITSSERKKGTNREVWDGKDVDGKTVPNEAYFFCIEAEDV